MANNVKVQIIGDASKFKKALGEVDDASSSTSEKLAKLGKVAATGFAVGGAAAFAFGKASVSAASDLNEVLSKSEAVFGDLSAGLEDWASNSASALGQSKTAALGAAASYGNLFQAFGLGQTESAEMSKTLVELASDLASFNNTSVEEALSSLQSGLSGETEPLKKYGVALSDVRIKEEALALGLIATTKEALTPAIKAQAIYSLTLKDTKLAQGDFAKTSDGLANKQRILAAKFTDLQAVVGQKLLPVMVEIVGWLTDNMPIAFDKTSKALVWLNENAFKPAAKFVHDLLFQSQGLVNGFTALWLSIKEGDVTSDGFVGFMETIGNFIHTVVLPALDTMRDWFVDNWPEIKAAVADVVDWLANTAWPTVQSVAAGIVEAFGVAVDWVKENWPEIKATIASVIDWISTNIVPVILEVVQTVVDAFQALHDGVASRWENIKKAIENVLKALAVIVAVALAPIIWAWSHFHDEIMAGLKAAWDFVKSYVEASLKVITGIIDVVLGVLSGDWGMAWDGIKNILAGAWDTIKATVQLGLDAIVTAVSGIGGLIASAAVGMFDGIKEAFKAALNWIIGKWNGLEFKLPSIDTNIPGVGKIGGFTLGTPNIPMLAAGGIVTKPTLAMVGEAGPEAVIPLNKAGSMLGSMQPVTEIIQLVVDGRVLSEVLRSRDRSLK